MATEDARRVPVGDALRRARQQAGLTQEQLAERAGLSVRAISDLERGLTANPRRSSVQLIMDALGLANPEPPRTADTLTSGLYAITPVRPSSGHVAAPLGVPPVPRPSQLPMVIGDFTGRSEQVDRLCELLRGDQGARPGTVRVVVVDGAGGLGKTTLAVRAAHLMAEQFPDGQLYANLRGATSPVSPTAVLARFLRDLGAEGAQLPTDEEELAARFRSRLAGQQVLIVLDDAQNAARVEPLLPGTSACCVLVTSRNQMPDLAPASTLHLPGMSKAEAHALFIRIVGAERVQAEPDATEQVLQVCAGLPLAVRIAGSRLAARGGWSVRTLADRLSDERRRLDELRTGNLAVRACFEVSYASLPSPAAREAVWPTQAFCLLGLWTGPFISLSAAAALLGRSDAEAMDTLEVLVDAHLLESPTPDLYRFHDLIRVYAAHQGQTQLTESDREAAIERLLTWYLHTAEAAAKIISPMHRRVPLRPHPPEVRPFEFKDLSEALAWCESERAGLTAATSMAAECHMHDLAWKIPAAAMSFNYRRSHWVDLEATGRIGLVSARILGDRPAEAWMLNNLGMAYGLQGNEEAISYFQQSRDICREHHDAREESRATTNLACAFYAFRDYNQARVMAWDSLRQESGSRYAEGLAWNILGAACCALGNPGEGVGHLQKALDIFRELGDKATQATCLTDLGAAHLESDHLTSAREYLKESLMIKQEIGDFDGLATTFWHLGNVERRAGNAATAKEFLTESLQVAKKIGDQKLVADIGANLTAVEDAE